MKEFQLIDEVMPQVPPADHATVMAARARMLGVDRRRHWPVWPKVMLAAVAVSAVVAGGFVAVPLLGGADVQTAAVPEADAVLAAAADRLAARPPGTGAWWRREMVQVARMKTATYTVEQRVRDVLWASRQHGYRTQRGPASAEPLTPADAQAWKDAGSPDLCDGCLSGTTYFTPLKMTTKPVTELPTEPEALKAEMLRANTKETPEAWLWGASKWLLLDVESTPATRAALYRVLAGLPGVRVENDVTDIDGRTGVALTYGEAPTRQQIIIDRDSGQLLAIQEGDGSSAYVIKRLGWTDDPAPKESTFS
ncbi:CU044_5270 family protein [Nonomuraea sp. SBT364]|uniref:CU044_5270 family protein n=1 Tax=Nonomuraea sp. SBT364 TaxID=1580530 RepID=UPI00066EF39F|nr:CU044_5270 family protein [Nonomuraea sp. SBT364]